MIKPIPFVIIGAGPAGLAAAIAYGPGAVILERNPEAGKKLLLSGSGQCNFTNNLDNADFSRACRRAGPFLKRALYAYDSEYFIELLARVGCPSTVREDGKVFPSSMKAVQVRDAMLKLALQNGAGIEYEKRVTGVEFDHKEFILRTDSDTYHCRKLLISTGGSSWPQTGSAGDGYVLAKALGHQISPIRSALAALDVKDYSAFKICAGNTLTGIRAEFITNSGKHKDSGDVLFTHTGLSGPLILNNSYLLKAGNIVRLHLLPEAENQFSEVLLQAGTKQLLNALRPLPLPQALLEALLKDLGIDPEARVSTLSRQNRNLIISQLQTCDFTVKAVESLDTAMSTAGGVLLQEVDSATMQSRIVPGLFLAGEVLDYALPTGGFNIQTAFSTGSLAGRSAGLAK